jgi:hypothetical protein
VLTAYLFSSAALTTVIDRLAGIYGPKKMLLVVFQCNTIGTMLRLCTPLRLSILNIFFIPRRSQIPLVDLKLIFHKIIRVGIIRYFMLGIIFELNFIHKVYFLAYSLKFNGFYYLSFGYDE